MRKLILATIILFSSLLVYSQKNNKISYCAFLNIGGVTSNNTGNPVEYVPIDMEIRNINGTVNFLSFRQLFNEKTTKKDVSKLSMSFSGGTKVNFKLKNNLFVTSGIGLSALKVVRNIAISNSSRFNVVDTSNGIIVLEGGHILPTSFSNTGTIFGSATYKLGVNESYSFFETQHIFSFVTLDIPLGLQYLYKKFKLEQGVNISIILNTKSIGKYLYEDPELSGPIPQFENRVKSYFNYSGGIDYSVSKKVTVGATYKIGLSNALQADGLSSLRLNSFGLQVSYNFKN